MSPLNIFACWKDCGNRYIRSRNLSSSFRQRRHQADDHSKTMASNNTGVAPFDAMRAFWSRCIKTPNHVNIITVFTTLHIFLLPLLLYILCLGYQQWKAQRLLPTPPLMNLTDIQTYTSITMQLCSMLGTFMYLYGSIHSNTEMVLRGFILTVVTYTGLDITDVAVCVLHYMAVVHPVYYLELKRRSRARTCSIYTGWILLVVDGILMIYSMSFSENSILYLCMVSFSFFSVIFCSISALWALKRPRPGEAGGSREKDSQSKQRAFQTIKIIMTVLSVKFAGTALGLLLYNFAFSSQSDKCAAFESCMFFALPSNLVLPLLYLYRAGKLPCLNSSSEP